MANMLSLELGWNITKPHSSDYYDGGIKSRLFESALAELPDGDHIVPGTKGHVENPIGVLSLETHPCYLTRVFVSMSDGLGHGDTELTEPPALAQIVREFIARHDPEAVVTWGIIETER